METKRRGSEIVTPDEIANRVVLITGPSGSGKTHICNKLLGLGHNAIDLDSAPGVNSSADGKANTYSFDAISRIINERDDSRPLFLFGLSGNILDVMHKLERRGALILGVRVADYTVVQRRIARGKAFDLSLDPHGHRQDLNKYHALITPHVRGFVRSERDLVADGG